MANAQAPGVAGRNPANPPPQTLANRTAISPASRTVPVSPVDAAALTAEQRELVMDVTQIAIDLVGIADPTPIADTTNALISVGRADWTGAGLSLIAIVPYVGDVAKAGKFPRYLKVVERAIVEGQRSIHFARRIRPSLLRLRSLFAEIPTKWCPANIRAPLQSLKHSLDQFLYGGRRIIGNRVVEQYVRIWEKHIDNLPLPSPGKDRGALWSKLDAKRAGDPGFTPHGDHPGLPGSQLARKLAAQEGKVTLEAVLESGRFEEMYGLAVASLTERLGRPVEWHEFGKKVWERVSTRYVQKLEGRVTVFVDDEVLRQALREGRYPVLTLELQELLRRKHAGDGVTTIFVKDIFDGVVFEF